MNIYGDTHFHTSFSSDSETPPRAQIEKAVAMGMTHITVTDHHDPDFPPGEFDFLLDIPAYVDQMRQLREEYREKIDLGIGLELGLQPHLGSLPEEVADSRPFDFIIGSTHVTRGIDPWEREKFISGITEEEAYRIYFEEELTNLRQYDCYDVAGHLDYVVRYGPSQNRFYTWERYGDILDEILRTLVEKGKGIEYNTAGFRAGLGYGHPMPEVWRRYRELGGEILTIGSDAHEPENLGSEFTRAGEFLRAAGFRWYAGFRERKPEFFPL